MRRKSKWVTMKNINTTQRKTARKEKMDKRAVRHTENNKMATLNPSLSIITSNVKQSDS